MTRSAPVLYTTQQLASLTGVTARVLHWWTERSLLKPATRSGRELFWNKDNRAQVEFIAELRRRDFHLARIRKLWHKHQRDVLDAPRSGAYLVIGRRKGSTLEYTTKKAVASATRAMCAVSVIEIRPL
jgi:DNA-binding transcriptional MerR regulator